MVSTDSYLSVSGESQSSLRDKASKFLAFVTPVTSEEEVKQFLEGLKKEYYQANHHCYAYRLGHPDEEIYRMNDDGEPSGSAGKPIFGQLLSRNLSDLIVVVVRYFGGTKLGIPGLIHAYRASASEALDQNQVITKWITDTIEISFPVQRMNEVMRILKQEGADIHSQDYHDHYSIRFSIRKSKSDLIQTKLSQLTNIDRYL